MKVFELFNTSFKKTHVDDIADYVSANRRKLNKPSTLGHTYDSGTSAGAEQSDDPHMIDKYYHSRTNLPEDGFYAYAYSIAADKSSSKNPYFPRIYNIDVTTDSVDDLPTFKIEKLTHLQDCEYDALLGMAYRMFDETLLDSKFKYGSAGLKTSLINVIVRLLVKNAHIVDPALTAALEFIHTIIELSSSRFVLDIHNENVMVRRGKTGLQLVISDPLI